MKKILLYILCANTDPFLEEFYIVRSLYDRVIRKYNLPIQVYGYISGDKTYIDKSEHMVYVHRDEFCKSDFDRLIWYKTRDAFQLSLDEFDYDWMLRTNTSTIINLQLLNNIVQSISNGIDISYGPVKEIVYKLGEIEKRVGLFFLHGNCMLMSRKSVSRIVSDGNENNLRISPFLTDRGSATPIYVYSDDIISSFILGGCLQNFCNLKECSLSEGDAIWCGSCDYVDKITFESLSPYIAIRCKNSERDYNEMKLLRVVSDVINEHELSPSPEIFLSDKYYVISDYNRFSESEIEQMSLHCKM